VLWPSRAVRQEASFIRVTRAKVRQKKTRNRPVLRYRSMGDKNQWVVWKSPKSKVADASSNFRRDLNTSVAVYAPKHSAGMP
jgi:hypothetical protein